MKSDIPKQFLKVGNRPVIMHSIQRFVDFDPSIQVRIVLPEKHISFWKDLCKEYAFNVPCLIFYGGDTRYHSVKNGLKDIPSSAIVAVHDAVRPLVSKDTIKRCFGVAEMNGTAIPVINVNESVRRIKGEDSVADDRSQLRLVQTPQVFSSDILKDAYNLPYEEIFTDDAGIVEKAGYKIYLTEGNAENIKITSPIDMLIASAMIDSIIDH